jgi:hypothetical protein
LGEFPQLYIQNGAAESMQMYVGGGSSIGQACIYYNSAQVDPEIRIGTGATSSIYPTRVRFPNTTASTSATTGAVVFDGGVGIAGALFTAGAIRTASTTASTSVSTGALISDGGLGVAGAAYIGGLMRITDTTASTSYTTGCVTFGGGVGISGRISCDTRLQFTSAAIPRRIVLYETADNDYQFNGFGMSSGIMRYQIGRTTNSHRFYAGVDATSDALLMRIDGALTTGSTHVYHTTASTTTGTGALIVDGGLGVAGNAYIGGLARITNTTASTSYTTGCVTFGGGIGVDGVLFTHGAIRTNDTTASSSVSTGSLIADGGLGVAGNAYIGGLTRITNTTASTNSTTGCATFAGGVGCTGRISCDTRLQFTSSANPRRIVLYQNADDDYQFSGFGISGGVMRYQIGVTTNSHHFYAGVDATSDALLMRIDGSLTAGSTRIYHTTASTTTGTGALIVDGGLGVAGAIFVGGAIRTTSTTASTSVSTGSLIANGGLGVAGNAYIGGLARVTDTTASSSTNTGCATFAGGVGIAGALNVGGAFSCAGISFTGPLRITDATASTSTVTGCATFAGGIGVDGSAYIRTLRVIDNTVSTTHNTGCAVFAGGIGVANDSYFNGRIRATRPGGVPQLFIENNITESMQFYVTDPGGAYPGKACIFFNSAHANPEIRIGASHTTSNYTTVRFPNTAASTSTTTGAVIVAGGIGVGGAIYTGSDIVAGAHLYSSSADDTTGMGVGSLQVYGGTYVQKRLIVDSGDQATSTSTGAIRTSGGLAVTKNAYIGGDLYAAGTITTNAAVITGSAGWSAGSAITPTDTGVYRIYQLNKTITIQFVSSLGYKLPGSGTYGTLTLVNSSGTQIVIPSAQRPSEDVYIPVMITTDVVGYIHFVGYVMVQQSSGKMFLMRPEWNAWVASSQVNTHPINISYPIA